MPNKESMWVAVLYESLSILYSLQFPAEQICFDLRRVKTLNGLYFKMAIRNTLASIYLLLLLHESLYQYAKADVYLHTPRGSNNRLNGNGANRRNANRVFDSQVRSCLLARTEAARRLFDREVALYTTVEGLNFYN